MDVLFEPTRVAGSVVAPSSKSYVQRIAACAALADGTTVLDGYTPCEDSERSLGAAAKLGLNVRLSGSHVELERVGAPSQEVTLYFGGSATSMRIFTSVSCVTPGVKVLTGSSQLLRRPIKPLVDALHQLGAKIETQEGGMGPLRVHPTGLRGGQVDLDASISSQYTSSIMIGAAKAHAPTRINHVGGVASKGYIAITAQVLGWFGVHVDVEAEYRWVEVRPAELKAATVAVEGDYSSAAFLMVAGALGGWVEVGNLNPESLQPDRRIVDTLRHSGCTISWSGHTIRVEGSVREGFDVDVDESPDLAPILAVAAAYTRGGATIRGVHRLRYKETDRVSTILDMLRSIGVNAAYSDGAIRIVGGGVRGGVVDSHGDHRIALAAAVAATASETPILVRGFECIRKSYPEFLEHYSKVGGRFTVVAH